MIMINSWSQSDQEGFLTTEWSENMGYLDRRVIKHNLGHRVVKTCSQSGHFPDHRVIKYGSLSNLPKDYHRVIFPKTITE